MQRDGLPPRSRLGHALRRGDDAVAAQGCDGAQYLFADLSDAIGEAVPTAFGLDSSGTFLFAAGTASGRLASYRVNGETGALTPMETYAVGKRPAAVLAVPVSR